MIYKLALGEDLKIVTKSGGNVIVPDFGSTVSATLVTDTQLDNFRSWYPDGSVTSPRQFTELNYDWNGADRTNHVVSAFQFAGEDTTPLSATNRDKTGRVVIPPYVDHDGERYTVTEIGFRSGPTQIDEWTGAGITEVVIPETVTKIGRYAFYGCHQLKSVTIPNSVSSLTGSNEFTYCTGLEEVFVGRGVKSVSDSTYYGCSNLKVMNFGSEPRDEIPAIVNCQMAFPTTCLFVVPDENYDEWVAQWAAFIANGYKVVRYSEWDSPHRYEISVTLLSEVYAEGDIDYTLYQNGLSIGRVRLSGDVKSGSVANIEFRDERLWDGAVDATKDIKGPDGVATESDAGAYIKLVVRELDNWIYTGSYQTFELPPTYNSLSSRWEAYSPEFEWEYAKGGVTATELTFENFRVRRLPRHVIYIKADGLGGGYIMEPNAPQVQLSIENNIINARIKPGTLTRTEFADSVISSLNLADAAISGATSEQMNFDVSKDHVLSIEIKSESVNRSNLSESVVSSLNLADTALQGVAEDVESNPISVFVDNKNVGVQIKPNSIGSNQLCSTVDNSLNLANSAIQDVLNPDGAQISLTRCEVENQPRISAAINEFAVNTREIANCAVTSEKIGIIDESTGELYTISISDGRVILKLVNPPSFGDTIFKFYGAYNENYTIEGELNREILIEKGLCDSAGKWVKQPKTVMVGTKVTSIADRTLAGCDVEYVQIPDSVTAIGEGEFSNCTKLSTVNLPNGLTNLDDNTFWQCSKLSTLTLPDSLSRIGLYAFYWCWDLLSVDIPDSVTVIDEAAFAGCLSLSSVSLPNNLTKISPNTFYNCPKLSGISLPTALREIGDYAFYYCTDLSAVTIPYYVRTIGEGAFSECSSITSAVFGNSLLSVGGYAFYDCSSLVYVKVPNATTYMGPHLFRGCPEELFDTTSVEGVGLVDGWAVSGDFNYDGHVDLTNTRGIAGGAFEECSCVTGVTLPPNITNIPPYAFNGCRGIKSIAIPNTVTFIGVYGLAGCGFTTLTIPDSVTYIEAGGLANCDFTSVQLSRNLTEITYDMFGGCRHLKSIVIPEGVSSIHALAFYGCWELEEVTLPSTLKNIDGSSFGVTQHLYSITIPASVVYMGREVFHSTTLNSTALMDLTMKGKTKADVQAMENYPWGLVRGAAIICTDGVIVLESGSAPGRTFVFDKYTWDVWALVKDGELAGRWVTKEVVHLYARKTSGGNAVATGILYMKPESTPADPNPAWVKIDLNPQNGLRFTYRLDAEPSTSSYGDVYYDHHWEMETVTESDPVEKRVLAKFQNEIVNILENYDISF